MPLGENARRELLMLLEMQGDRLGEVPAAESAGPQTAQRMDRMIIVVLLAALGYFAPAAVGWCHGT